MQISELTIRLLLVFLPGISFALIVDKLTPHHERQAWQLLLRAFLFGSGSYALYGLIWLFVNAHRGWLASLGIDWAVPTSLTILRALVDQKQSLEPVEIGYAVVLALPLSLVWSWGANRKLFHRLVLKVGISNKFADLDVWSHTFNLAGVDSWVTIRDRESNLMYLGRAVAFSDHEPVRELTIAEVAVCENTTGKVLYELPVLYLSRPKDNWEIEFPNAAPVQLPWYRSIWAFLKAFLNWIKRWQKTKNGAKR